MIKGSELDKNEKKLRVNAAKISLVIGVVLMFFKFWAHNLTNSQAIFSDALESIVNVAAASLALFVIYYAAKPIDEDHPYGHGKIEYFSAAFEGGLISFAALFIIFEAIRDFFGGPQLQNLSTGLIIVAVAGLANGLLGWFLLRQSEVVESVALKASGKHVISDCVTSAGIIVGLLVVWVTKLYWLDSVIAIGVGLHLAREGVHLIRDSVGGLMDEEDEELLKDLAQIFDQIEWRGIIQIHHVRLIRSGWYHHIDAHVVLPEVWNVQIVHEEMLRFENAVIGHYRYGGEMNFHVDPCRRAYCKNCDLDDCPIRQENFEKKLTVTVSDLRSKHEPEQVPGA